VFLFRCVLDGFESYTAGLARGRASPKNINGRAAIHILWLQRMQWTG